MGLRLFGSCSRAADRASTYYGGGTPVLPSPPEPDPTVFAVKHIKVVNGNLLLLVHYPACTTFQGYKLLLIKGQVYDMNFLDPHLLGDGHPVIARFEPTPKGWELATACAQIV